LIKQAGQAIVTLSGREVVDEVPGPFSFPRSQFHFVVAVVWVRERLCRLAAPPASRAERMCRRAGVKDWGGIRESGEEWG